MTPRRILIVSNLWPPVLGGGAEAHAAALASRLRDRGHEVGALTFGIQGPDVVATVRPWPYRADEFASQPALRRFAFHALDVYRPGTRRVMSEAIRSFAPDVVHTHAVAGLSSTALAEPSRHRVAHVHTLHDYWLICQRRSLTHRDGTMCEVRCRGCRAVGAIRNAVIGRHPPSVVLAVSQAIADEHADLEWMRDRVRVVPNPTDPAPRARSPRGGPPVFGFIGRLTVEKGLRTLLAGFQQAGLEGSRLLIAGDGPLREEIAAAARPGIELIGWVDADARDAFFSRIDGLVVPSEYRDPAPLVVGEARVRGVPVVGARIGGIPELVSARSAGLLFPPGDPDALAARLRRLAAEPGAFVDDGRGDLMTWDHYLEALEGIYDEAVAAVGGATAVTDRGHPAP